MPPELGIYMLTVCSERTVEGNALPPLATRCPTTSWWGETCRRRGAVSARTRPHRRHINSWWGSRSRHSEPVHLRRQAKALVTNNPPVHHRPIRSTSTCRPKLPERPPKKREKLKKISAKVTRRRSARGRNPTPSTSTRS